MADVNKIIFEYNDGSAKYLSGAELERWEGFFRQMEIFCTVQKMNPDWSKVNWTEVEKIIESEPKNAGKKRINKNDA